MSEELKEVVDTVEETPQVDAPQDNAGILYDYKQKNDEKKSKKARKKLTPEQRKKRTIRDLIITGCVFLVLGIFIAGVAIANVVGFEGVIKLADSFEAVEYTEHTQLTPTKDSDGYYTFTTDRDIKVLQFTDVHIGGGSFSQTKDAWAMNAVATMIREEQPDLVIITGDIAYPVPFQAGTFNNLNATKIFATMMESLEVYWTFTFGNHDTEAYSMYEREDICDYYENAGFKYCLFERGFSGEGKGYGNNIIKVKNSDGIITQAFVTIDSHSYTDGDVLGIEWKYDNIKQTQVDWYALEMDKLVAQNVANGGSDAPIKNMAFFHIPLVEYRTAWGELMDANQDFVINKNEQMTEGIQDTTNVKYFHGIMGESDGEAHGKRTYGVFCGIGEDEFFETGLENGLQATFSGHDHYNNFSIEYKGVRLTYGMSIDYLAYPGIYKDHLQRGCTVITVRSDSTFDIEAKNYYSYDGVEHEKN